MDQKALPVLRRLLREFIKADPREVVLKRPIKIASDNGSWTEGTPEELDPQIFCLVPMKRRLSALEVDTQDGKIQLEDWVLVGEVKRDIQADDEFELNGDFFKVVRVEPKVNDRDKADRVVAQVTMLGVEHDGHGEPSG
jgi:hypothetical protein